MGNGDKTDNLDLLGQSLDSVNQGSYSELDYDPANVDYYGLVDYKSDNVEQEMHRSQSGIRQLGSGLFQAGAEVVGGTIEGIGYLGDAQDTYNALKNGEVEVGNFISEFGKSIKEGSKEVAPIYSDPFKEGQFSPEDWSWWMSNMPSIASSLSLMIPSGVVTQSLSGISKGLGLTKLLSKSGNLVAKGITQAAISRQMESFMEASGVQEETYNALIKRGVSEEIAKKEAGKAAADNYKANWAMLAQDIVQYTTLIKPFGKSTTDLTVKTAKRLGKDVTPVITNKMAAIGADMVGEAAEEGYQYIAGERAREMAEVRAGLRSKRNLGVAVADYMGDGDFWSGAFFGALGAGTMQTAGKGINMAKERVRSLESEDIKRIKDIDSWSQSVQGLGNLDTTGEAMGTPNFNSKSRQLAEFGTNLSKNGNLGWFLEVSNDFQNMSEEDQQMFGFTPEDLEASKKQFPNLKKDLEKIGNIYEDVINNKSVSPAAVDMLVQEQFLADKTLEQYRTDNSNYSSSLGNITGLSDLNISSPVRDIIVKEKLELNNLLKVRKDLKANNASENVIAEYDSRIKELRSDIAESKKDLTEEDSNKYKSFNTRATDFQNSSSLFRKKEFTSAEHKSAMEAVEYYSNPENNKEIELEKVIKTEIDNLKNNTEKATSAQEVSDIVEETSNLASDQEGTGSINNLANAAKETVNNKADEQESTASVYKSIPEVLNKKYKNGENAHLLHRDIEKVIEYAISGKLVEGLDPADSIYIANHIVSSLRNESSLQNLMSSLKILVNPISESAIAMSQRILDLLNAQAFDNVEQEEKDTQDSHREINQNPVPEAPSISTQGVTIGPVDKVAKKRAAIKAERDKKLEATTDLNEKAKINEEYNALLEVTPSRYHLRDNSKGLNFAGATKAGKVNLIDKDGSEANQTSLDKGEVKVGDTIHFEVDKTDEYAKEDPQKRKFFMVVYKGKKRIVVGAVPVAQYQPGEVKTSVENLRNELHKAVNANYEKSGDYVDTGIRTVVGGANYEFSQSKEIGSPIEKILLADQKISQVKNIGGYMLTFVEKSGFTSPDTNLPIEMNEQFANSKPGDLIIPVPHPIMEGQWLYLEGFRRSLGQVAESSEEGLRKYNSLKNFLLPKFVEYAESKNGTEAWNAIGNYLNKASFRVTKTNELVLKNRSGKDVVSIPRDEVRNQIEDANSPLNMWLDDQYIIANKALYNTTKPSEGHIFGTDSFNESYNELIAPFIGINTVDGRYLKNTDILAKTVEDYTYNSKDKGKAQPTEESDSTTPQVTKEKDQADPSQKEVVKPIENYETTPEETGKSEKDTNDKKKAPKGLKKVGKGRSRGSILRDNSEDKARAKNNRNAPKWDKKQETDWFNKNFPNVPLEVLDNLKEIVANGSEYWGVFKNAAIYIEENAAAGTLYHEAFHAVFNLFTTVEQRSKLLREASKKYGIKRSKFDSNAEFALALEEAMADDFMEVVQMDEVPKTLIQSIGKAITDFFRNIQALIKSMYKNPTFSMDEFMWRANNGFYKKAKIKPGSFGTNVQRNRVKDWTYKHEEDAIKSINGYLVNNVIPDYKQTEGYEDMSTLQIVNEVGIENLYREVIDAYLDIVDNVNEETKENIYELLNNFYDFETDTFLDLFPGLARGLTNYNIKLKPAKGSKADAVGQYNAEDSNEDSLKEADEIAADKKENWQDMFVERSSKDTAPARVKEFIRNMYIPGKKDSFGLDAIVDFEDTYNTLLKTLAGSTRVNDIVEMLEFELKATNEHPEYAQILEEFKRNPNFKTEFFQAFNNNHTKYLIVSYMDGNYATYEANRAGLTNMIITNWRESVLRSDVVTIDKKGETTIKSDAKQIIADIRTEINNVIKNWSATSNEDYYKPLSEAYAKLGIKIEPKVFKYIGTDTDYKGGKARLREALISGKNNFNYVLNKFENGINPFEGGLNKGESEAIKQMAKWVSRASTDLYESSFRKIDNKTAYAHLEQSFITKLVHNFKNPNKKNEILLKYSEDQLLSKVSKTEDGDTEYTFHNRILEDLANNKETLEIYVTEGLTDNENNRTSYDKLDKVGLSLFTIHSYFNNNRSEEAIYRATVLSDSSNGLMFKHKKETGEKGIETILNKLTTLANAEHDRIVDIAKVHKAYDKGEIQKKDLIENYHIKDGHLIKGNASTNGYHIIQALRGKNHSFRNTSSKEAARKDIDKWLQAETRKYWNSLIDSKVIVIKDGKISKDSRLSEAIISQYPTEAELGQFIKEFYYNDYLSRAEFSLISIGDPAFYKAGQGNNKTIDYVKRAKEIFSPKSTLDIFNTYTNPKTGEVIKLTDTYKTIYLSDNNIKSPSYDAIKKAIKENKNISPQKKAEILAAYGDNKVNQTDAQAYITLPFYRKTMIGMGRWTDKHQRAYDNLIDGKGVGEDISLMMQPLKPFAYGLVWSDKYKRLVPVQNKNSEYLLLPQLVRGNAKLENLYNYMIKNDIDSANFDSAVKAGLSKTIDNNTLANPIELDVKEWSHDLNMEDRGIQQEVPEHFVDADNLFASQIRKLIMSDITDGTNYFNGMDAKQLLKMYEDLIIADLQEAYDKTSKEFVKEWNKDGTPKTIDYKVVYDIMLEEAYSRNKGEEFEKAIEYDGKRDRLALPAFNPITSNSTQNILTGVFKNRITKQKIKGGAFVQASSFGLSEELELVYNKDNGLEYAEIMLPAFSKKFFEDFKDDNGDINFDAINSQAPEILDMIGYRIPTEDKYSMLPMKVVGFLPYSAGGAVMLPADITTISGSDFDVDKMYIMMKAFDKNYKVIQYNEDKSALENSKEARDNRKIDLMLSVLRNPATLKAIMSGGTFAPLQDISEATEKKIGKSDRILDPMSLNSMDQMHIDNMTGKSMVGIAANENSFHAIAQHAELSLSKDIKFDNILNLNSLSGTNAKTYVYINKKDKTDIKIITDGVYQKISKNKAYYLAAIVDNAKDPLAAYINYNDFTSGIVGLLTQVGLDPATVTWFLKQPIMTQFTEEYYKEGATSEKENKLIEKYRRKFKLAKDIEEAPNLNTKELYENLNKTNEDIFKDLYQREVFKAFMVYRKLAKDWTALILASRADTKGFGPDLATAEVLLRAKTRVISKDFSIKGAEKLFDLQSDGTKLVSAFTELGVKKPNDIVNLMFPYGKGFYKQVKDAISNNIKDRELTANEINNINSHITTYLLSQYDFFNPNDRNYYINTFPSKFLESKQADTNFANNALIKRLEFTSKTKEIPIDKITFNNTGSLTPELKDSLQKGWLDLYESEEYNSIAKELLKYSYFTTGLNFGVNGFSHLIPSDMLMDNGVKDSMNRSISEALYDINDQIEATDGRNIFLDQYYKNSYKNKSQVPTVNEDFSNISEKVKDANGKIIGFTVNKDVKDRSLVLEETKYNIEYVPYITYSVNNKIGLFKFDKNTFTYNLVNKLGVPNYVFEYLINQDGYNSSVILSNNITEQNSPFTTINEGIKVDPIERVTDTKEDFSTEEFQVGYTTHLSHEVNKAGETTIEFKTTAGNTYIIKKTKNNEYIHVKDIGDSVSPALQQYFDNILAKINEKNCG